jgi:excisionase family DNA binding protein
MSAVLERPTPSAVQTANQTLPLVKADEESVYLVAGDTKIRLDPFLVHILMAVFEQVRQGKPVSIIPHNAEMTTQQAATLLNVSRPFVSKLIKDGQLAYEMRGTHRRIRLEEVMRYREERSVVRKRALRKLASLSEEFGLPD